MDVNQENPESSSLKSHVAQTCRLQDYIQGFAGYAKISRLMFLAEQCAGTEVALAALKMAHDELKENTLDTDLYKTVIGSMHEYAENNCEEDAEWIEKCESRYFVLQEDLEQRLVTAKSALDQRQIAALEKEYGDLLCRKGLFGEGMKHYLRIREYSKDPDDVLGMLERAALCAFDMKNYFAVINHSRKADMFDKEFQGSPLIGKIKLLSVLTQVALGRFDMAAKMSSGVKHHAILSSPDVISPSSFALCALLCAIASMDRKELDSLGSLQGFQAVIDLAPQQAQDAFKAIRYARYGQVLLLLEELRQYVWIDNFLEPHMASLYSVIQDRCICEYSRAFSRISLPYMADMFGLKHSELENRLSKLIRKGTLHAKLDAHAEELILQNTSARNEAYHTAIQAAQMFVRDSSYLIMASQSIRAGLSKTTSIAPTESIDPEELSKPATLDAEEFKATASTQENT